MQIIFFIGWLVVGFIFGGPVGAVIALILYAVARAISNGLNNKLGYPQM